MLTLHEDRSAISEKQASEKQGREAREGGWFLRAAFLNRPQPHRRVFGLTGHRQTACAYLLNLEIGHNRGWGKAIYQWFFPWYSHVSLLKSNPPVWTLPNFQVVSPGQLAASGETRIFAAQSGQGVCPGAPPHRHRLWSSSVYRSASIHNLTTAEMAWCFAKAVLVGQHGQKPEKQDEKF